MKRIFTILIANLITSLIGNTQTITSVENVYGGRINAIAASKIAGTTDSFNVFITTESANTAFFTKARVNATSAATINTWTKVTGLTAGSNYGSGIQNIATSDSCNYMLFVYNNNIYKADASGAGVSLAASLPAGSVAVDIANGGRYMYFLSHSNTSNQDQIGMMDFGAGGTNFGTAVLSVYSTATYPAKTKMSLAADSIVLIKEGSDPEITLYKNLTSGTKAFEHDALAALSTSIYWNSAAIAPDGRVFVGGSDNSNKYIAYRDTTTAVWTVVNTGIAGTFGKNIAFYQPTGSASYYVYFGSAYSTAKGAVSTWANLGNISLETHSNDGASFTIGANSAGGTVLFTTDQGLGWTKNSGSIISEINEGIEAVQVNDFDMRSDKDFGWLASKAGVRYVRNYNTASKAWSNAMFPNGDGSPYYSAEMVGNDSNSVYVGNVRVYKTTNKGTTWSQVFTAENAPYNFPGSSQVTSIAVSDSVNNIVMAGYKIQGSQRGGVFYSTNGGSSWSQLLIYATVNGQDVDVNDIEITSDSGKVVAYIGVDYDNSVSPIIRGMYKAQWNGASWTVRAENIYSPSTSLININDIVIHSRDTILASGGFYNTVYGREYGINFMVSRPVYNTWTSYVPSAARTSGFSACAWHGDTLFYAYKDSILYSRIAFSATGTGTPGEALYTKVDNGTEINVLYYDELLAGSGTGFKSIKGANFTLPSKIIAFNAIQKENEILLSWINDLDDDVSQYKLQYSCNGGNFITLANIASTKLKKYSYLDVSNCTTDYRYYRLMIVDKSGNTEYSNIIKVGNQQKKLVKVFPNPVVNGMVQVQTTLSGNSTIQIIDIAGRERMKTTANLLGIASFSTLGLTKGMYLLQITNVGEKYVQTIFIQ